MELDKQQFETEYGPFGVKISNMAPSISNPTGLTGIIPNSANNPTNPSALVDGQSTNSVTLMSGFYRSYNFVTGASGWQIDSDGNAEFNNVTVRGTITASTITGSSISGGTITGTTINGGTITGATIQTASSGQRITLTGNALSAYDSASPYNLRIKIDADKLWFYDPDGIQRVTMKGTNVATDGVDGILIDAGGGDDYLMSSAGFTFLGGLFSGTVTINKGSGAVSNLFLGASLGDYCEIAYDDGAAKSLSIGNNNATGIITVDSLFVLQSSNGTPGGTATAGGMYFDTGASKLKFYDGSNWRTVTST